MVTERTLGLVAKYYFFNFQCVVYINNYYHIKKLTIISVHSVFNSLTKVVRAQ